MQNNHKIKNYVEFPALARGAIGGKWMNVVVGSTNHPFSAFKNDKQEFPSWRSG